MRCPQVYEVNATEHPIEYATSLPPTTAASDGATSLQVDVRSLESSMRALNHSLVDILRIGGHRSLHEGLLAAWIKRGRAPAVCQVREGGDVPGRMEGAVKVPFSSRHSPFTCHRMARYRHGWQHSCSGGGWRAVHYHAGRLITS